MLDKFVKLVVGDPDEKRAYKQMMKRVDALPEAYRFAYKKMQQYFYTVGWASTDQTVFANVCLFTELIELLEVSAADGRSVAEVVGDDVSKFCDEFVSAYADQAKTPQEQLNKEIMEKFEKEKW
ncbi:MAG: DUF1048 domain-containing protein [Cellulosilyticaceae bacterium]